MNNRLQATIALHDVLHGFRQVRGEVMASLEENLVHHLVELSHEPLFRVFLDV